MFHFFFFRASNSNRIATDCNPLECEKPRIASSPRQVHPLCEEKAQLLAYDKRTSLDTNQKRPSIDLNASPPPYPKRASLEANLTSPSGFAITPNICVEGGRIEFIKQSPDGSTNGVVGIVTPPATPRIGGRITVTRGQQTSDDEEKFDELKVGGKSGAFSLKF